MVGVLVRMRKFRIPDRACEHECSALRVRRLRKRGPATYTVGCKGLRANRVSSILDQYILKRHPGSPSVRSDAPFNDWIGLLQIAPTSRRNRSCRRGSGQPCGRLRLVLCPLTHAKPSCLDSSFGVGTVTRTAITQPEGRCLLAFR